MTIDTAKMRELIAADDALAELDAAGHCGGKQRYTKVTVTMDGIRFVKLVASVKNEIDQLRRENEELKAKGSK